MASRRRSPSPLPDVLAARFAYRRAMVDRPLLRAHALARGRALSAPVAQLDRALPSEGRGQGFESLRVRHTVWFEPEPPKNVRFFPVNWIYRENLRFHRNPFG